MRVDIVGKDQLTAVFICFMFVLLKCNESTTRQYVEQIILPYLHHKGQQVKLLPRQSAVLILKLSAQNFDSNRIDIVLAVLSTCSP